MKTNHRRGFIEEKSRFDSGVGTRAGGRVCGLFGWEFTNGHRGHARAKAGLKKSWKKAEKRSRAREIRVLLQDEVT